MNAIAQLDLSGNPWPVRVGAHADRGERLLDELDDLITLLDGILADQQATRLTVTDAESETAIIEASLALSIEGKSEQERKARLTLALHADAGYQQLAHTVRDGRAALWQADRRLTVLKERIRLTRAALALLTTEATI